jgi:hypothetical protein
LVFDDEGRTPEGEKPYPHERVRKGYKTLDDYKLHGGSTLMRKRNSTLRLGNDHAHNEKYGDGNALVYHTRELQTNRPGAHNFINLPGEEAIRQLGPTHYGYGISESSAFDEDQGPMISASKHLGRGLNTLEYYPNYFPKGKQQHSTRQLPPDPRRLR